MIHGTPSENTFFGHKFHDLGKLTTLLEENGEAIWPEIKYLC